MKKYSHLSVFERETLGQLLVSGLRLADIAQAMGRDKSTLCREIKDSHQTRDSYRALTAQYYANQRKLSPRKTRRITANPLLEGYIQRGLKLRWSPEQIAERIKLEYPENPSMRVSHETIYTYLYVLPRGELKKELLAYLRSKRRLRKKRGQVHSKRGQIPNMISIEERPKEAEDRSVPGHWEGDLIVGKEHSSALGTLVERTTRTTILVPLKEKDAQGVRRAFARATKSLPAAMKLSLTYDRGKEMTEHELFTKDTKIKVYFAHPQSPWERGTNENTNGLIRQFFPRGTDFREVDRREIKRVQDLLNGRPRKALDFLTPFEVFNNLLH
jgi:IS30 family transposase